METHTIITRTSFCQHCFNKQSPKTDEIYVVHGSTGYHIRLIEYAAPHYNPIGFVPAVFELYKAVDGFVYGTKICSIDGCGYSVRDNPAHETDSSKAPYLLKTLRKDSFKMSVKDWNALILTKDFGYKIE